MHAHIHTYTQIQIAGIEPSWLYIWIFTMILVLPATCQLRSALPGLSSSFNSRIPFQSPLKIEVCMCVCVCVCVCV